MHHVAHVLHEWNVGLESERLQRCDILRRHPYPEFSSEHVRTDQTLPKNARVFVALVVELYLMPAEVRFE
jgi:hypothetical protein